MWRLESALPCDCKGPDSQRLRGETSQAQGTTGAKALRQKCVHCWSSRVECGKQTGEAGLWLPLLLPGKPWKTGGEGERQTELLRLLRCCCVGLQWLGLRPGLRSTPSSKDGGEGHSQRLQGGKRPGEGRAGQVCMEKTEVKSGTSAVSRPERPRAGAESGSHLSDVSRDVQGISSHRWTGSELRGSD